MGRPVTGIRQLAPHTVLVTRLGAGAAVLAALCYSSFLLSPLTGADSTRRGFISELEAAGQPWSWLYRLSDVVAGLAMLATAASMWSLLARLPRARWACALLATAGLGSVVDGASNMRCEVTATASCAVAHTAGGLVGELSAVHTDSGLANLIGIAGGAVLLGVLARPCWPVFGPLSLGLGLCVAATALLDLALLLAGADIGSAERLRTLLSSGWLLLIGGWLPVGGPARPTEG